MAGKHKIILGSFAGTILEFYDFALFGVFTPIFSEHFFPSEIPGLALLMSLGVFAAGFIMRPFGAMLFGYLGDTHGRLKALQLSLGLIALPTFIIGFLPDYAEIGILSPSILILCRLLQGLAVGGEHNGAAIFLIEHLSKERRGFAGAIILSGVTIGATLAMAIGSLCLANSMPAWAWRVPFVTGILIIGISFYVRYSLNETPEFQLIEKNQKKARAPLKIVFSEYPYEFISTLFVGGFAGILAYTMTIYMNIYLIKMVHVNISSSMLLSSLTLFVALLNSLFAGFISDKIGYGRTMMFGVIFTLIFSFPIYYLLYSGDMTQIIWAQIMVGIIAGTFNGPMHAFMNQLFPAAVRYTGVSLAYSIGMAVFGGTTPLISTFFIQQSGNPYAPSFYLILGAFLGLTAISLEQFKIRSSYHSKLAANI